METPTVYPPHPTAAVRAVLGRLYHEAAAEVLTLAEGTQRCIVLELRRSEMHHRIEDVMAGGTGRDVRSADEKMAERMWRFAFDNATRIYARNLLENHMRLRTGRPGWPSGYYEAY